MRKSIKVVLWIIWYDIIWVGVMKTVRAKTMDRATCLKDTGNTYQAFVVPEKRSFQLHIIKKDSIRLVYYYGGNTTVRFWQEFTLQINPRTVNQEKYFDIDNLARLAEEESFTMPRGLTREQRREWAKRNLINK